MLPALAIALIVAAAPAGTLTPGFTPALNNDNPVGAGPNNIGLGYAINPIVPTDVVLNVTNSGGTTEFTLNISFSGPCITTGFYGLDFELGTGTGASFLPISPTGPLAGLDFDASTYDPLPTSSYFPIVTTSPYKISFSGASVPPCTGGISYLHVDLPDHPSQSSYSMTIRTSGVYVPPCAELLPNTFTPDRFGALPSDRMQVVAMYDGAGAAALDIHLANPSTGECCVLTVGNLSNAAARAEEYDMHGFEPTGQFEVRNAVADGGVDGVAFGLYLRDTAGERWMLHSRAAGLGAGVPNFVGGWPIAWSEATWDLKLVDLLLTPSVGYDLYVARRQAQMTLSPAQLLPDGIWNIPTGRLAGDLDGNGCVDGSDLGIFLANWGCLCP